MRSEWKAALALLTISGLLALFAAELVLRAVEDGRPWKRRFTEDAALISRSPTVFDPAIGTRFRPGWTGKYYFAGDSRFTELRFNSFGFRFPEYGEQRGRGYRVALLGDSLVAALQVEADSHFRALLEGSLNRRGPAEVLNFAVAGTGPVAQLNTYRKYASRFSPDVVVLGITTLNDFLDNIGVTWKGQDGALVDDPFRTAPGNLGKFLKTNSSLVMALWSVTRKKQYEQFFRRRTIPIEGAGGTVAETDYAAIPAWSLAEVSKEDYENTLDVWDALGGLVGAGAAKLVVVMFPHNPRITPEGNWDYRPEKKALQDRLSAHFLERGASVITGSEFLERHQARYGKKPVTKYMDYLSEEGHKSLADLLARRIDGLRTGDGMADSTEEARPSGGTAGTLLSGGRDARAAHRGKQAGSFIPRLDPGRAGAPRGQGNSAGEGRE